MGFVPFKTKCNTCLAPVDFCECAMTTHQSILNSPISTPIPPYPVEVHAISFPVSIPRPIIPLVDMSNYELEYVRALLASDLAKNEVKSSKWYVVSELINKVNRVIESRNT